MRMLTCSDEIDVHKTELDWGYFVQNFDTICSALSILEQGIVKCDVLNRAVCAI